MTRPMTPEKKQRLLEVVANMVGFEYLTYLPASLLRPGLLYEREHPRMSVWNPRVEDGDLFRLAVATPAIGLQKISRSSPDKIEIRCASVREVFVKAVATTVIESSSNDGIESSRGDIVVGGGQ